MENANFTTSCDAGCQNPAHIVTFKDLEERVNHVLVGSNRNFRSLFIAAIFYSFFTPTKAKSN